MMQTITKYKVLTGNKSTIAHSVTNALAEGWILYGYPFSIGEDYSSICQAVIRQEEKATLPNDNSTDNED